MKRLSRTTWIGIAAAVVLLAVLVALLLPRPSPNELKLNEYEQKIADGQVRNATFLLRDSALTGELTDGTRYTVAVPKEYGDRVLTEHLVNKGVEVKVDVQRESLLTTLLYQYLPILLLIGVFGYFISGMMG